MPTFHSSHEILLILAIAIPLIILVFIGGDQTTNPLVGTIEESPKAPTIEERIAAIDATSQKQDALKQWDDAVVGFNRALQEWQGSLNALPTATNAYGTLALGKLLIDVYERLYAEGMESMQYLKNHEQVLSNAGLNIVVVRGQIIQRIQDASSFVEQYTEDLLIAKKELIDRRSAGESVDKQLAILDTTLTRIQNRPQIE